METQKIDFTRINNDVNGNPRYVCHFYSLLTKEDHQKAIDNCNRYAGTRIDFEWETALKRAKQLGGRKFHNKQYGGGIVFQSYNIADTERRILELIAG